MTLYEKKLVASSLCEKVSGELNQHDMHECVNTSPPPLPFPQLFSSQSFLPRTFQILSPSMQQWLLSPSIHTEIIGMMISVCWGGDGGREAAFLLNQEDISPCLSPYAWSEVTAIVISA